MGTEDVLTCHVIVLHHPLTAVTAIAPSDEYIREPRLEKLVQDFLASVRARIFVDESAIEDEEEDDGDYEWEEWEEDEDPEDFGENVVFIMV